MKNKKMIGLKMKKKAVSPLIATVLLIAFAVALGAVVMNWGRGYVEDTANIARERSDTEVTCASDVGLAIVEIDSVPQVCYNDSLTNTSVEFIVENKKTRNIEKIQARVIGDKTRVPYIQDLGDNSNISKSTASFLNFTYAKATYGTPQQVKLTSYIKVGSNEVACAGNAVTVTNIKPCAEVWV